MNSKSAILKLIETTDKPQIGDLARAHLTGNNYYQVTDKYLLEDTLAFENKKVLPIIVTGDAIEVGDWILHNNKIYEVKIHKELNKTHILSYKDVFNNTDYKKILLLPEQIPQNIIDAIVAGKLKDGDVVLVYSQIRDEFIVDLIDQDFAKVIEKFSEEQSTSDIEEAAEHWASKHYEMSEIGWLWEKQAFKAGIQWRDKHPKNK